MPTLKPRINVTLQPQAHSAVQKLSELSGESMSSIVAGFVELVAPSLERVVVAMERARDAPKEVRLGLLAAVERAERDLVPHLEAVFQVDDRLQAELAKASRGRAGGAAQRPRRTGRAGPGKTPA